MVEFGGTGPASGTTCSRDAASIRRALVSGSGVGDTARLEGLLNLRSENSWGSAARGIGWGISRSAVVEGSASWRYLVDGRFEGGSRDTKFSSRRLDIYHLVSLLQTS